MNDRDDIPTAVKEPHSANNHIGNLLPLPLEGRIDKSTETGVSSKEGNDIEDPPSVKCKKREAGSWLVVYGYR